MIEFDQFPVDEVPEQQGSFEVGVSKDTPLPGNLESALGLEAREIAAPMDPKVQRVLDLADGKQVPEQLDGVEPGEATAKVRELMEQNKRLAAKLGQQGNEVIGPLRQENEALRERLARLEGMVQQIGGSGGGRGGRDAMEDTIEQTVMNLYGPNADPKDEIYRTHALAHINAGNLLGKMVEEQMVKPLREELAQVRAQVVQAQAYADLPQSKQQQLIEQYPSLSAIQDPKVRASVMRDLANSRPLPVGQQGYMDPARYVESTQSAAPVKRSSQAATEQFDRLSVEQQEFALGQMLARRGLSSLGLS